MQGVHARMYEEILTAADSKDAHAIRALCKPITKFQNGVRIHMYLFDAGQRSKLAVE